MALNTNQMEAVRSAFAMQSGHQSKLNDFIMELQGTGSDSINKIVNDLVFLRREMSSSYPDPSSVQRYLAQIYRRARALVKNKSQHSDSLSRLCNTINSIR